MPIIISFSVHAEFAVVVGEKVRLWTEIELGEDAFHAADILPHHVLAADLE